MTDDPEITDPRDPYRRPDIVTELDRYLVRDETVGFTEMVQRARDEIEALRGLLEHSDRTVITAVVVATPAIRDDALEEAAQACVGSGAIVAEARLCASAIRALKGQAR